MRAAYAFIPIAAASFMIWSASLLTQEVRQEVG